MITIQGEGDSPAVIETVKPAGDRKAVNACCRDKQNDGMAVCQPNLYFLFPKTKKQKKNTTSFCTCKNYS